MNKYTIGALSVGGAVTIAATLAAVWTSDQRWGLTALILLDATFFAWLFTYQEGA